MKGLKAGLLTLYSAASEEAFFPLRIYRITGTLSALSEDREDNNISSFEVLVWHTTATTDSLELERNRQQ